MKCPKSGVRSGSTWCSHSLQRKRTKRIILSASCLPKEWTLRQCMWPQHHCHCFLRRLKSRSNHPANSSPSHPNSPQRRMWETRASRPTTSRPRSSTARCQASTKKTETGRAARVPTLASSPRLTLRAGSCRVAIA